MLNNISNYFQMVLGVSQWLNGLKEFFHYVDTYKWIALTMGVLFILAFILLCRMEKQMIHCFEACDEKDLLKPSAYTIAMNDMAVEQGFINAGWFKHSRGGLYQGTATTWFSEDYLILLVVGGGKMGGLNIKKTMLFSKTTTGHVLLTCDVSGVTDITGITQNQVLWNADLRELYDLHRARLDFWADRLEPFGSSSPLEEYESIERRKVQMLVDSNLAEYLDFNQNEWRFTFKSAFLLYFRHYRADLKDAKKQKERFSPKHKRPGDA